MHDRNCDVCSEDHIMAHLQALLEPHSSEVVDYTQWENVKVKNRIGKEVNKTSLVHHEGSLTSLSGELVNARKALRLPRHLFNARWQRIQFSYLIKSIPDQWVVLNLDYKCADDECVQTIQETIYFISNDLTPYSHAVHHFLEITNNH